jgi:hypothetical protein
VRRRLPIALAAAASVLATATLTACQTHVGTAALVNGHKISESDVRKYVDPAGPSPAVLSQANNDPQVSRAVITNVLVGGQVYRIVLAKHGGATGASALRQLHDQALQELLGANANGTDLDAQLAAQLRPLGIKLSLLPKVVELYELEFSLIERIGATKAADLVKAVSDEHLHVSVNPAYGRWNATSMSVAIGELPQYLKTQSAYQVPGPAPTASPTG